MTVLLQLFNKSQYPDLDTAHANGAFYGCPIHAINGVSTLEERMVLDDVIEAVLASCEMLDGGYNVGWVVWSDDDKYTVLAFGEHEGGMQ